MMLLRVVNYAESAAGIPRLMVELLGALVESRPDWDFEFVSHGPAMETFRRAFEAGGVRIRARDIRPRGYWRNRKVRRILGVPGTWRLARMMGFGTKWDYDVPPEVFEGCDAAWFPCLHLHRLSNHNGTPVFGHLLDTIGIEFPGVLPDGARRADRALMAAHLRASIRVVVTSDATAHALARIFGVPPDRVTVIPVSGEHRGLSRTGRVPAEWGWAVNPFLLCASSTAPHKNHETLLRAAALGGKKRPLVLTGAGVDFSPQAGGRAAILRDLATSLGLRVGMDVIAAGFVDDEIYAGLLERARALVMPSLAEGGGSFPAAEAVARGVPVVCSDIPVMREHLARLGAEALWFDPRDPGGLARALDELEADYPTWRARAIAQAGRLRARSWRDVAGECWRTLDSFCESRNGRLLGHNAAVECRAMTPAVAQSLLGLFCALEENGDDRYFHPHPLTPEQVQRLLNYRGGDYYCVTIEEGAVAGYGMLRGWDEGYPVPSLGIALHPGARNHGRGRSLMLHLHAIARARNASRIRLKTYVENRAAVELYKELGYRFCEREGAQIVGLLDLARARHAG